MHHDPRTPTSVPVVPQERTAPGQDIQAEPADPVPGILSPRSLTRRRFLAGAAVAGGGMVAATVAACTPAAGAAWTFGPTAAPAGSSAPSAAASAAASAGASSAASMSMPASPSAAASPSPSAGIVVPQGWTIHDVNARTKVRRYIGALAPALQGIYGDAVFTKLADILGAADAYPELSLKPAFAQVPQLLLNDAVKPLTPTVDNGVKVFQLTIEELQQHIDEQMPPLAALGYNGQWPGPTIRVTEGDRVRAIFTNKMKEATGVHFHGVEFDDFFMDGVPFVTQKPFAPGETFTYEFTASRPGSLMYHSHHNATDQVGRGLLGAFLVAPKSPAADDRFDRDYVWISNDALGGFTINGHGFPAVLPVLAAQGETVRIRFMNEGTMMHPWHSHGYRMRVVARDGYPLGSAAFDCDTLGVNPGERWDVNIKADRLGVWAFHCHILPHVEGADGMFGMVNTLIVVPKKAHVDAIVKAVLA
ncbi:MAG TPA: multicopper oxidase domain-containing protein [Candidatus Dormibacteraeota bacterium]|nr:multicopper oxidase domain-containing protein [Candidatus Dormibacteraeota bacterium]